MNTILKFLVIAFLTLLTNQVFSQDPSNIITVDIDKNDKFYVNNASIPHGQKISLIGTQGNTVFKKIEVEVATSYGNKRYDATIDEKSWRVDIGPFQPRQLITLTIKTTKVVGDGGKEILNKSFTKALNSTIDDLIKIFENNPTGIDSVSLKKMFLTTVKSKLGSNLDNYFIAENKKVVDNLENIFDTKCLYKNLLTTCRLDLLSVLGNYRDAKIAIESLNIVIDSLEKGLKEKTIFGTDTSEVKKSKTMKASREVQKSQAELDFVSIKTDLISKIPFQQITSVVPLSSVELKASGIEYYAGFDVSAIMIDKKIGSTGLYFTVSPYVFGKFDPELDFSDVRIRKDSTMTKVPQTLIKGRNIALWLKYHISPTIGIGFSGNSDIPSSPQLFAGISLRLNRLFKVTVGSVFYKNSMNNLYEHNFGIGMSLSVNYFGTLLQMLGNATRSVSSN